MAPDFRSKVSGLRTDRAKASEMEHATGLDPQTEAPFYGLLGQELETEATAISELVDDDAPPAELTPGQAAVLRDARVTLFAHLRAEIGAVGFWQNAYAQDVLHKWVVQHLDGQQVDGHDLFQLDRLSEVADRVVELARANHGKLVGAA